MKKILLILFSALLILSIFSACAKPANESKIIVGATPTPHGEILEIAKEELENMGYELEIKEFTDYVQPNLTLDSGDLDANYFQHKPYLDDFNENNNTKIVSMAAIHYEPFGVYAGKIDNFDDLPDGAQIAVPNDATNEARALLLLEAQGIIKVNPDAGLQATVIDIIENSKDIKIIEIEAAQLARSLPDVDMAVINGNYAIQAGLNAATDALAIEDQDSLAAETFANIVAVREGEEDKPKLKALVEALKSEKVKKFIEDNYKGAVVAVN